MTITGQQEDLIGISETLEMLIVPLEYFVDFASQLGIESLPAKLRLWNLCLSKVLIIEVIKAPIFLLGHISESKEGLLVPIDIHTQI